MIETLLGFVKDGIAHFAVVWKPYLTKFSMCGMIPSAMPRSRYSGSNPSMQTTTVGVLGRLYVLP